MNATIPGSHIGESDFHLIVPTRTETITKTHILCPTGCGQHPCTYYGKGKGTEYYMCSKCGFSFKVKYEKENQNPLENIRPSRSKILLQAARIPLGT